ncbi:MAG TPA: MFS transporter [Anaerolineales bacterium]|nr:MFS transporter [Anaerolineales bacterium]
MNHRLRLSPFLWLCLMGGLAIFSSTMSKNPALPLFIRSLGVEERTLGFIAAASTVTGIVVSLPAGLLSDRWGRWRVIRLSLLIFASAPFLYLLVRAPWHLVLVRIYHGLATAILGPVALAAVADTFQEGRGERMGWYASATLVGRLMAPTVGGFLIFGDDFRWVYLGCGAAGLLALLAGTRLPYPRREEGSILGTAKDVISPRPPPPLRLKGLLLTSGMEAAQYFAYGAVETFLPLYLRGLGWEPRAIGPLFTLQVAVLAAARPWMGRISDRWGRKRPIFLGLLVGAGATAAMGYVAGWVAIAGLIGLFGLGMAAVTASTAALISELSPKEATGGSLGMLSSVMDVGHAGGPMLAGLAVSAWGYGPTFGLVGGLLAVAAALFAVGGGGVNPIDTEGTGTSTF